MEGADNFLEWAVEQKRSALFFPRSGWSGNIDTYDGEGDLKKFGPELSMKHSCKETQWRVVSKTDITILLKQLATSTKLNNLGST